ncbi:MAG: ATP-binding protein [Lachnospiraceae bacterium]
MKIKTRLCIAFCTILFVPMLLVVIAVNLLMSYQLSVFEKTYNVTLTKDIFTPTPVQLLNRSIVKIQEDIQKEIDEDPTKLKDLDHLKELDKVLEKKGAYIVVREDDQIIYASEGTEDIISRLPDYGEADVTFSTGTYFGDDKQKFVKQQDFLFSDNSKGSVFIICSVNESLPEMQMMFIEIGVIIVLVMFFTAAALTMWIYRSICKPIGTLKIATRNIKEGNLNFTIVGDDKDEIGQLCSDFEEMRQRLKESAEEKIQFDADNKELISNISHDLKTPITAIKGYVEGIMDGVADTPEKIDKYIRTIYNKANDMDRLIDELTFYSKIDTNRIPYTFSKINVSDYFGDCAEEVGLDLESKNVEFGYYNYCDESIVVIADAEQLKRVVNNIISNSVKYFNKSKGKVNIRIKDVGDFIQVEIEDNGKGIAQKDLPYIFDRFYRTDSSRNSSKGGSGIGLSIVKKIIEDHGGKIWATSKEGTGTVMYFVLRKYQEVRNE